MTTVVVLPLSKEQFNNLSNDIRHEDLDVANLVNTAKANGNVFSIEPGATDLSDVPAQFVDMLENAENGGFVPPTDGMHQLTYSSITPTKSTSDVAAVAAPAVARPQGPAIDRATDWLHYSNIESSDKVILGSYADDDGLLNTEELMALVDKNIIKISAQATGAPLIELTDEGRALLETFKNADTNNSLLIDVKDFGGTALVPLYSAADTNRSNMISFNEFVATSTSAVAPTRSALVPTSTTAVAPTSEEFAEYSVDDKFNFYAGGEALVTKNAYLAGREQIAQQDGRTFDVEAATAVFNAINTDGDDFFTLAEFQNYVGLTPIEQEFVVFDTRHDNLLSKDEIAIALYDGDVAQAGTLVQAVKFYPGSNPDDTMTLNLDEYQIASTKNLLNPTAGIIEPPDAIQIEFDRINTEDGTTTLDYTEIQAAYGLGATDAILMAAEQAYANANPDAPVDGKFDKDEFHALLLYVDTNITPQTQ